MITRLASNVSLIDNHVLWRSMVPTASRAGGTRCLRTRCGGTCRIRQAHCTCGDAETNQQSELQLGIIIEVPGLTSQEGNVNFFHITTTTRGARLPIAATVRPITIAVKLRWAVIHSYDKGRKTAKKSMKTMLMAEREGFEPSIRFPVYTRSRRAPSTTRPPLRLPCCRGNRVKR